MNLGVVRKLLGDFYGCREAYEKAVQLSPDEPRELSGIYPLRN